MSDQHVLIIGGGIGGLVIAQGLKKHGINFTVFEKEPSAEHYRLREWGLSLHWAIPLLEKCVPKELAERLQETQADPNLVPPQKGEINFYNATDGEIMAKIPVPFLRRVSRNKMRKLLTKDLDIKYGKQLKEVSYEGEDKVVAHFEDGTSASGTVLIGCDGAKSRTREAIFGEADGVGKPMGVKLSNLLVNYKDAEKSKKLFEWFKYKYPSDGSENSVEQISPMCIALHQNGHYTWMGPVDVPDQNDHLTWQWQLINSVYSSPNDPSADTKGLPGLSDLKERAKVLCSPFREAIEWIPEDTNYFQSDITQWIPRDFDQKGGRITLSGDAWHPMAPHRGQGLNHSICDSEKFVDAMTKVKSGEKSLRDAVDEYTTESLKRGKEETELSERNAIMQHDLEKFLDSPFVKHNVSQQGHGSK